MNKIFQKGHDPLWHILLVIISVMVLQYFTNSTLLPYNKYAIIAVEAVLLIIVTMVTPSGYKRVSRKRRTIMLTIIAVVTLANAFSLILLLDALFYGGTVVAGRDLLLNGMAIYLTNILMFALWYWEMDGGGPDRRATNTKSKNDFVFPQVIYPSIAKADWQPGFSDYLYLSSTNVTNFASADTQPLTHRAKYLMMSQAFISVITIALVIARAISIIK